MPEVSLVAILDADKEGFLRSEGSLIQTIGRAARNVRGPALHPVCRPRDRLHLQRHRRDGSAPQQADRIQCRAWHHAAQHRQSGGRCHGGRARRARGMSKVNPTRMYALAPEQAVKRIKKLEAEMMKLARNLEFEQAARLRDEIQGLRRSGIWCPADTGGLGRTTWRSTRDNSKDIDLDSTDKLLILEGISIDDDVEDDSVRLDFSATMPETPQIVAAPAARLSSERAGSALACGQCALGGRAHRAAECRLRGAQPFIRKGARRAARRGDACRHARLRARHGALRACRRATSRAARCRRCSPSTDCRSRSKCACRAHEAVRESGAPRAKRERARCAGRRAMPPLPKSCVRSVSAMRSLSCAAARTRESRARFGGPLVGQRAQARSERLKEANARESAQTLPQPATCRRAGNPSSELRGAAFRARRSKPDRRSPANWPPPGLPGGNRISRPCGRRDWRSGFNPNMFLRRWDSRITAAQSEARGARGGGVRSG